MPTLTPAVAYYRMSSDRQETSIRDQREAVEKYAADNGYRIIGDYVDEGISGWKTEQRKAFSQLIQDAPNGDFQAVLCWDQDRFSRFDPLEANHFWYLLDQANVHLATVAQGRLDWHDLGGWLTASVHQHGKAQYVKDLARNSARGTYAAKRSGKWCGPAPFGYQLVDGRLQVGDPADVATVRRIFETRAKGFTLSDIAKELNAEGIATPRGSKWRTVHLRVVLDRVAYKGATPIGVHKSAKFSPTTDTPEIVEGTHYAIVDKQLWDQVQAMPRLVRSGNGRGGSPGGRLSGLAYCSRCGSAMYCCKVTGGNRYYLCGNYHHNREHAGKRKCGYCCVKLEDFEGTVFKAIRDKVLRGSRDRLVKAIEVELNRRQPRTKKQPSNQARIAKLNKQIESATERLLLIDEDLLPTAQAKLREMVDQRDTLVAADTRQERTERRQLDAEQVADLLWELPQRLAQSEPAAARAALQRIVDRIDLDFELDKERSSAKRKRFVCTGGVMRLRSGDEETADR